MGRLDKKVLKVIASQEDMDYDVGDISIALKCEDEEVEDALDSLKDQGLIEAVIHNGKKYWKPARPDTFTDVHEPEPAPQGRQYDDSLDLLILDQPAKSFKSQEQIRYQHIPEQPPTLSSFTEAAPRQAQMHHYQKPVSTARSAQQAFENDFLNDNTQSFSPPSKIKPAPKEDSMNNIDDDDFEMPRKGNFSIASVAVAVMLSAGISALIAMYFTSNSSKEVYASITSLEGKVTESSTKLSQRIDALSAAIDNMKKDLTAQPPVAAAPVEEIKKPALAKQASKQTSRSSQSMKSSSRASKRASSKHVAAAAKKRKSPAEIIQETSSSASSRESYSGSSDPAPASETANSPSASEPSAPSASDAGSSPASEPSDASPSPSSDGSGQ